MSFTPATPPFPWQPHAIVNEYLRAANERGKVLWGSSYNGFPDLPTFTVPDNPALRIPIWHRANFWAALQAFIHDTYSAWWNPFDPADPGVKVNPETAYDNVDGYPSAPDLWAAPGDMPVPFKTWGGSTYEAGFHNFLVACGIPAGNWTRNLDLDHDGVADAIAYGTAQQGDVVKAINFQELQRAFIGMVWYRGYTYGVSDAEESLGVCQLDPVDDPPMTAASRAGWNSSHSWASGHMSAFSSSGSGEIHCSTLGSFGGSPWNHWVANAGRGKGKLCCPNAGLFTFPFAGKALFFWRAIRRIGSSISDSLVAEPANKTDLIPADHWTADINGEPYTRWAFNQSVIVPTDGQAAKTPIINDGGAPTWCTDPLASSYTDTALSATINALCGIVRYDVSGAFGYYD